MRLNRPPHLTARTIRGRGFGEPLVIRRVTGMRDRHDEYHETETPLETMCATIPGPGNDARARELTEGGVQLNGVRTFYTVEDIEVASHESNGDILVYPAVGGERYRAHSTQRWDGFSETIRLRDETQ